MVHNSPALLLNVPNFSYQHKNLPEPGLSWDSPALQHSIFKAHLHIDVIGYKVVCDVKKTPVIFEKLFFHCSFNRENTQQWCWLM